MTVKVQNWGNSAAVRLSRTILDLADIQVGTHLSIVVRRSCIILEKTSIDDMFSGSAPDGSPGEFSWEEK